MLNSYFSELQAENVPCVKPSQKEKKGTTLLTLWWARRILMKLVGNYTIMRERGKNNGQGGVCYLPQNNRVGQAFQNKRRPSTRVCLCAKEVSRNLQRDLHCAGSRFKKLVEGTNSASFERFRAENPSRRSTRESPGRITRPNCVGRQTFAIRSSSLEYSHLARLPSSRTLADKQALIYSVASVPYHHCYCT
jgi:hypothetical protein